MKTIKTWFKKNLEHIAYIPDDLSKHIATTTLVADKDPWWLAEAIVISALENTELEKNIFELIQILERSIQNDMLLHHMFEIVERVIDVMSYIFQNPTFKNDFTTDNAFVTLYYVVVFIMCCSLGENRDKCEVLDLLKQHESIIISLASMASKLLLNNDVYEFSTDTVKTCMSRVRMLC